jgi:hypothetical protein
MNNSMEDGGMIGIWMENGIATVGYSNCSIPR